MSRCLRRNCCRPCCSPVIVATASRPRISRALLVGALLALVLGSLGNNDPNINSNIINLNGDPPEDDPCCCNCGCNRCF